jgi:hypothetical protein
MGIVGDCNAVHFVGQRALCSWTEFDGKRFRAPRISGIFLHRLPVHRRTCDNSNTPMSYDVAPKDARRGHLSLHGHFTPS